MANGAAGLSRPLAALQQRLPRRREHPGVAVPRRGRQLRSRLARADGEQPAACRHGAGLLPPLRGRVQSRSDRRRGGDQLGGALSGRRGDQARLDVRGATKGNRQAGAGRRRRAVGPVGGLPPAPRRPSGHDHGSGTARRGDDAFRHSQVPPAARHPRRRSEAHHRHGRRDRVQPQGRQHSRHDEGGQVRRRVPRCGCPHRQARLHSGRRSGEDARRRFGLARHGGRRQADAGPPRRRLRRRQHRTRRRPDRQAPRRDRSDHRLSAQPREDARARFRGRGGAAGRRDDQVAVDDQEHGRRGHADGREDGTRREGLPATDRRVRDAGSRHAGAGPRAGRRPLAAQRRSRARDQGRHRAGRSQHDDRSRRHLCRRRHGALGAHRHRGGRPRQESGAAHRRLVVRCDLRAGAEARAGDLRQAQPLVLHRRARRPCGRSSTSRAGRRPSTRW